MTLEQRSMRNNRMKRSCLITALMGLLLSGWIVAVETQTPETLDQFQQFLEESLHREPAEKQDAKIFHDRAGLFWNDHLKDYLADPLRYQSLLTIYYKVQDLYGHEHVLDPPVQDLDRFKTRIEAFRHWDSQNTTPKNAVLFVGSSSIGLWETSDAFASYPIINRGFGGATLIELNHFYDDVIRKYAPAVIVVYCDHDVYIGEEPTTVLERFEALSSRIEKDLPKTRVMFLSIKPTPTDDLYGKDVRHNAAVTNELIKDFIATQKNMRFVDVATPMFRDGKLRSDIFLSDGMHLNAEGYRLWNSVVTKPLADLYAQSKTDVRESAHDLTGCTGKRPAGIARDTSAR
jgi:lysophospholipase L1-like esterase